MVGKLNIKDLSNCRASTVLVDPKKGSMSFRVMFCTEIGPAGLGDTSDLIMHYTWSRPGQSKTDQSETERGRIEMYGRNENRRAVRVRWSVRKRTRGGICAFWSVMNCGGRSVAKVEKLDAGRSGREERISLVWSCRGSYCYNYLSPLRLVWWLFFMRNHVKNEL